MTKWRDKDKLLAKVYIELHYKMRVIESAKIPCFIALILISNLFLLRLQCSPPWGNLSNVWQLVYVHREARDGPLTLGMLFKVSINFKISKSGNLLSASIII